MITFSLRWRNKQAFFINTFQPEKQVKMNIFSKNQGLFYPFFHFSANSRKAVDLSERENFGDSRKPFLKSETINARNLLKSYQPIHKLINTGKTYFKYKD